jgi:hypothetical protein
LTVEVDGSDRWKVAAPLAALAVAAAVIHLPRLGPQLLARAAWWSNLVVGVLLCVLGGSSERDWGFALAVLCGGALLVAGGQGLAEAGEREARAPAAFRGSLLLLMVLALADAQTFLLMGILSDDHGHRADAMVLFTGAAALACGFVGLYRLAVWGAVVNVAASVVLLSLSIVGAFQWKDNRPTVGALAGLQVVCAAPMLVSLALHRPLLPRTSARFRSVVTTAAIVAVIVLGGLSAYDLVDVRLH